MRLHLLSGRAEGFAFDPETGLAYRRTTENAPPGRGHWRELDEWEQEQLATELLIEELPRPVRELVDVTRMLAFTRAVVQEPAVVTRLGDRVTATLRAVLGLEEPS